MRAQPIEDLAEPADGDREMAVRLADVRLDAGDPLGQPAAVRDGDHTFNNPSNKRTSRRAKSVSDELPTPLPTMVNRSTRRNH